MGIENPGRNRLVGDDTNHRIALDPDYDPVPASIWLYDLQPLRFPCLVSANATGIITPTSDHAADLLIEITDLDISRQCPEDKPNCICILPDPPNPQCVIRITMEGTYIGE